MLFKHKHLLEDLRATGRKGVGEILEIKTEGSGGSMRGMIADDSDLTTSWMDCWMRLRVTPADRAGAPFEASLHTRIHTMKYQGASVPVWFDPHDTSRVVVDYEEDAQRMMTGLRRGDLLIHRNDQVVARAWTPFAGTLVPIEVLAQRGKGKLLHDDVLGLLVANSAQEAISAVRASAGVLLPGFDPAWFDRHDLRISEAYGDVSRSATPVDGADAALAVAAALVSLLSGRIVRPEVAVTGRLAGDQVLAVADLAGKVSAAKQAYSQRLVTPAGNAQDKRGKGNVELFFVNTLPEAIAGALARRPIKGYAPPA
jgi:hypothetical protein